MSPLPSSLSEEDVAALLSDLPDRPIPTYDHLPHADFLNGHLIPNTPFLLSQEATSSWCSRKDWSIVDCPTDAGPSRPNLSALRKYGHHIVAVANTTRRQYSEFERTEMPLSQILDTWESGDGVGMYVKDWHLLAEIEAAGGGAGEIYEVPECFREDWLNPPFTSGPRPPDRSERAAVDSSQCDFRFTYLGPRGTFTPLHRDVYASYSWSANIVGRKMWWLFPPDPEILGKLGIGSAAGSEGKPKSMVFDVRGSDEDMGGMSILQQEGEVIFVPSGWYHQVVNLDFCISINHNFIAPATLPRVYGALVLAQSLVEESISDVKSMIQSRLGVTGEKSRGNGDEVPEWEVEWVEEVQKLLEMDAGWGWRGFWECVKTNLESPPSSAANSTPSNLRNGFIQDIVGRYKTRREWVVLSEVRSTIGQIEDMISYKPPDRDASIVT